MNKYFTKSFFKLLGGFVLILLVSMAIIYAVSMFTGEEGGRSPADNLFSHAHRINTVAVVLQSS